MRIEYSAFILPHIGDKYSQCADRFGYSEVNHCFAIADGVGNSLFPGDWAESLCTDFIEHPMLFIDGSCLVRENELIQTWEDNRDQRVANLTEDEKFIYEMGLDKADFAAATFVGLTLDKNGWKCQAIGDSYLFVLDKNFEITAKVASMEERDFDNFPEYFASKKGQNNGTVVERQGTYNNVAYLVLMTDALSDWFIDAPTEKRMKLLNVESHSQYESFIDKERQELKLKDDDTTMMVLKVKQDNNDELSFETLSENIDDINSFIQQESTVVVEDNRASDNQETPKVYLALSRRFGCKNG